MIEAIKSLFASDNTQIFLKFLYYTSFIWLPAGLILIAWELWIRYVQSNFLSNQKNILLEIKIPKDVYKSPHAMEFFINNLYQTSGEKDWHEKYWKGGLRPWFSLEIVSIDGAIHFFIWTRAGFKNLIESNLYSQYPGIEIFQVEDYTLPSAYNQDSIGLWATEFDLTKSDAYPIKTYTDYGLDKDPKEEYKIDPLTPLIEFLGSLQRGHQVWIQILVRAHKEEEIDPKTGKKVDLRWAKNAEKEIQRIIDSTKGEKDKEGKLVPGTGRRLTDVESETIKALSRSVSKKGFDVGMRSIYIADKDVFNPSNIGGVIGSITHFNSNLNGFKPARGAQEKYNLAPIVWMNRNPKKVNKEKEDLLDKYKRRAYFYKPFKSPHFILNSEELATIFHFPGGVSTTPTFGRIESRKAEAPSNIPI